MTEHELQNMILHFLNVQHDFFAWRNQSVGIYDEKRRIFKPKVGFDIKGVADVLGIHSSGRLIAIEVKSTGKTEHALSKEQKAFLFKINKLGGAAIWASTFEKVEGFVNDVRLGRKFETKI